MSEGCSRGETETQPAPRPPGLTWARHPAKKTSACAASPSHGRGNRLTGRERSEGRQPVDGEARTPIQGHQTPKLTCFALVLRKFRDGAHHARTDRPGAFAPPIRQGKGPGVRARTCWSYRCPPPHSLQVAPASGGSCPCFPEPQCRDAADVPAGEILRIWGFGLLWFYSIFYFYFLEFVQQLSSVIKNK